MRITILLCLVALSVCVPKSDTNFLWPRPLNYTYDDDGEDIIESPCNVTYVVYATDKVYIQQMISYYLVSVFKCK